MKSAVVFYRLSRKVINNQDEIPEEARQVMYYSLLIGHHVGVMDCFSQMAAVPMEQYQSLLALLPDGEARRKLEGVLRWNEIEINRGHVDAMLPALEACLPNMQGQNSEWLNKLIQCMKQIKAEPAFYLMVEVRA